MDASDPPTWAAQQQRQLRSKLSDDSKMASKWWVLPLHANLPPEEFHDFEQKFYIIYLYMKEPKLKF